MTDDALRSLVVADKAIEAHNMVSFELVDPDGVELPAFSPGPSRSRRNAEMVPVPLTSNVHAIDFRCACCNTACA
jgi:hypothetical protein